MSEDHKNLEMEYDKELLEDVLDSPDLRYVSLFMYNIRNELFQDLIDDDLLDEFEAMSELENPTIGDLKRITSSDFIKSLIQFNVITNIKNYDVFKIKADDVKIRIAPGLKIVRDSISESEEEVHLFFKETFLERVISPVITEMSQTKIHTALERLRAMMCPKTSIIHKLVHKYGDYYVIDDSFYYIIEELGNPFQALRIELMIRALSNKYTQIENELNVVLNQFHPELVKASMMKKFRTAKEKKILDFRKYLQDKSRKKTLPMKFRLKFSKIDTPDKYIKWSNSLNQLISLKLDFDEINKKMDQLRSYYSGKKQIMPYIDFIKKSTYDEDSISDKIKNLLIKARNELKLINETLINYSKKEMKILNLDIERYIIEEGLDEEEED